MIERCGMRKWLRILVVFLVLGVSFKWIAKVYNISPRIDGAAFAEIIDGDDFDFNSAYDRGIDLNPNFDLDSPEVKYSLNPLDNI
jgi:hypothetical protein